MSDTMEMGERPFRPDPKTGSESQLEAFIALCERQTDQQFADYRAFEAFTVSQYRTFWSLFLDWSRIICEGGREPVCVGDDCETAVFFPELRLNYAENVLYDGGGSLIGCHTDGSRNVIPCHELRGRVLRLATFLRQLGIDPGDRVAAIARNNTEVIIAALATAAIGAVFSSCAHDMGTLTILSRFQQLHPKVLIANCASKPWDGGTPMAERISEVVADLPSLTGIIALDGILATSVPVHSFAKTIAGDTADFVWQRFPFNHPLFILFSSGTTGAPKCIMHGTGGTLLEHVKEHRLHGDLDDHDCMFFQTSCGWMMWNWQLSALACGADVVVYDGPLKGAETLWQIVADEQVTVFGTNPAYLQFTETAGFSPNVLNLTALRSVLSTGSILYPRQFDWVVEHVKRIPVQSVSGGTDILGCFVLGNPLLPVYRGQAQCRSLGLDVRSLTNADTAIGELVCANPFPSRPIGFYGETSNQRYHDAYFSQNSGVWTHGDLIELTLHGAIMHGRSDGIMNIRGVRIGPAEIYRILQQIPSIVEAMAVEQTDETQAGGARLILLVVLRGGVALDATLITRIRTLLADQGNPVMVPAAIIQMNELPVTHSGKRSEAAARDAVNGRPVRNRSALLNPYCLDGLSEKRTPQATIELGNVDRDLEKSLCALCQQYLNIPQLVPWDNYLAFGGDSLTILGFLMEVASRTKTKVPLKAMIGVSTIADLAKLLHNGVAANIKCSGPQVRRVEHQDEEAICRLLDFGFRGKLPWRRILNHPWQPPSIPRGFVLTDNDKIIGFLGLVAARRHLDGKSEVICNLTSWYVQPEYRGWSNALVAAATQFEAVTYTSLTPGKASYRILSAIGFKSLEGTKRYFPPLMHTKTLREPRPQLVFDPAVIRRMIGDAERQILDDHTRYECFPLLVIDRHETAFAVISRRPYRRRNFSLWSYSQVLYCNAPALLKRHIERVTLAVMRRQRTIGLTFSTHALEGGIEVPSKTLFRSAVFSAHQVDKLYSELALLPV